MDVVLIPGDGIGKEIAKSVKDVSRVLVPDLNYIEYQAGADYYAATDKLLEDGLLDKIGQTGLVLKGPTATPSGKGFSSINVQLRQHFDTYANLRPVHSFKGVKSRYEDVDLVVVRENTEDLYKGVEEVIDEDTVHAIKIITRSASERIVRFAFEYALKNNRKKVTCVHKANIMKKADGLFLETFEKISAEYPQIKADSVIIDALCMKLVVDPGQFDVLVAPNLYGDIISDLCAGLIGGLGFAPSVNIGERVRIYEAVHGSAPDIAGKKEANPTAILLALSMLLKDQGYVKESALLYKAIEEVIAEGKYTTRDIGGTASTDEYTAALLKRISDEKI